MAAGLTDAASLQLASAEEMTTIQEIRGILAPELEKLAVESRDWPHITSDIFMTRLLRGNNGSVQESAAWYRRMLVMREEYKLDDMHRKGVAENVPLVHAAMPHADECLKHMTTVFGDDYVSPTGHLIHFDAFGDMRVKELFNETGKEKWAEMSRFTIERRCAVLDKMSAEQGRIVKVVRILDVDGFTLSGFGDWYKPYKKDVEPCMKDACIEVVHLIFILNFPLWGQRIFNIMAKGFPERILKRIRVLGSDYIQDKEFTQEVGGAVITRCMAQRTGRGDASGDDGNPEGRGKIILAGKIMERVLEVKAGQRVVYTFSVGTAAEAGDASRGMLGMALDMAAGEDTSMTFSAAFWPDPSNDAEAAMTPEERSRTVAAPHAVDAAAGEQSGTAVADKSGVVILRWSNADNYVRAKVLSSFKIVTESNEGDVDVDDILGDVGAAA